MTDTEDKYRLMMQKLLPRGPAWTRDEGAELTLLLQGLAGEPARVEGRVLDLLEEIDPRTTTELLDDWERVCGLPGSCAQPSTTAERRAYIHQKLLGHGDPNLAFWQEQAEALGFTFNDVLEYEVMAAGFSAGDHVIGTKWKYGWVVSVDSLTQAMEALLLCTLRGLCPLHTVVEVKAKHFDNFALVTPDASYTGTFHSMGYAYVSYLSYLVIVGSSGEIQTSFDLGATWTHRANSGAYSGTFYDIDCYGGNDFVTVGSAAEIQRSTNGGATWVADTAGGAYAGDFHGVAIGATNIVIVGTGGEIQTSPKSGPGTWTQRTADASFAGDFQAVAYGNGVFVISGTSGEIQWSDDEGVTWHHEDPDRSFTGDWVDSDYANSYFWIVGEDGEIQQSPDGTNWRRITNDNQDTWEGVCGDGDEGIILVESGSDRVVVRTRIGPRMLFEDRTSPISGQTPTSIFMHFEYCFVLGSSGMIYRSYRYNG